MDGGMFGDITFKTAGSLLTISVEEAVTTIEYVVNGVCRVVSTLSVEVAPGVIWFDENLRSMPGAGGLIDALNETGWANPPMDCKLTL